MYCNLDTKIDSTSAIVQVLHQYVILVDGEQKVLGNLEMFSVVVEVTILTVLVLAEHCLSMAGLALLSCLDVDVDILGTGIREKKCMVIVGHPVHTMIQ